LIVSCAVIWTRLVEAVVAGNEIILLKDITNNTARIFTLLEFTLQTYGFIH